MCPVVLGLMQITTIFQALTQTGLHKQLILWLSGLIFPTFSFPEILHFLFGFLPSFFEKFSFPWRVKFLR